MNNSDVSTRMTGVIANVFVGLIAVFIFAAIAGLGYRVLQWIW